MTKTSWTISNSEKKIMYPQIFENRIFLNESLLVLDPKRGVHLAESVGEEEEEGPLYNILEVITRMITS